MKTTLVSIRPTEAAIAASRPALTPELLAASAARYSRNNEGLDSILAKIDPNNLDASVDSIFRMIDYGHRSIADMATVAIFIDGISSWLAYWLWSLSPQAGGQECSTRYIRISNDSLIPAEILGVPENLRGKWAKKMSEAFEHYAALLAAWEARAPEAPAAAASATEKELRAAARMRRNFAFDRARYLLPCASSTNMMLIMSARAWAELCQHLSSSPLPEANLLAEKIREELALSAPRLLSHSQATPEIVGGLQDEFERLVDAARAAEIPAAPAPDTPSLELSVPPDISAEDVTRALERHSNRYAWIGNAVKRISARFAWNAVAIAEIRDLNRHRTGNKYCPPLPKGFYLPEPGGEENFHRAAYDFGRRLTASALERLAAADPTYVYWLPLGAQFAFEHTTAADKFIYEAELRTGKGAHFRYKKHLHDALELWFEAYPQSRGLINEGV